jgi:hypothetical protein
MNRNETASVSFNVVEVSRTKVAEVNEVRRSLVNYNYITVCDPNSTFFRYLYNSIEYNPSPKLRTQINSVKKSLN